ncbi:hypothetical protein M413DRAFT_167945 [Hebeloma cylindrosporum]|uniref:Uncharacterized protein n=1 Tax=Hebeloma cylindrosporum TaxID=76867 RepID=A0A0C3BVZ0_HEBCY|nr:hypothetical protein M413DRAFT_167945 [Hebeloma cylindrosporum h7]
MRTEQLPFGKLPDRLIPIPRYPYNHPRRNRGHAPIFASEFCPQRTKSVLLLLPPLRR